MVFTIVDIPKQMRAQGWVEAAKLMERWFSKPKRRMLDPEKRGDTPPQDVESRLITMAWALRFQRARIARDRLASTWAQPQRLARSRSTLESRLRRWQNQAKGSGPFRFGDLAAPTATVDRTCQINIEKVSSSPWGTIDGFYAAIGAGAFKIAVSGMATPGAKGRLRLSIDEIGIYLRDTYDFNGSQILGQWGPKGFSRTDPLAPSIPIAQDDVTDLFGWKPAEKLAYFSVNNTDFVRYRDRFARGGDFVIFSDIQREKLRNPVVVDFS